MAGSGKGGVPLKPAPDMLWVVELRGTTVVVRSRGVYLSIPYPHAGLWAILADGTYSPERARALMACLMSASEEEAGREVERTLAAWLEAGFLVPE